MSYLPLLSFGPSVPVPGFGLSVVDSNLSAPECLTSLADGMTYYALC